jgi:hypothetical protein
MSPADLKPEKSTCEHSLDGKIAQFKGVEYDLEIGYCSKCKNPQATIKLDKSGKPIEFGSTHF